MPGLTPQKQQILDMALANPDDPNSRIIVQKAIERGWIKPPESSVTEPLKSDAVGAKDLKNATEAFGRGFLETGTPLGESAKYVGPAAESLLTKKPFIQSEAEMENRSSELSKDYPKSTFAGKVLGYMNPYGLMGATGKIVGKGIEKVGGAAPILERAAQNVAGSVATDISGQKSIEDIKNNAFMALASQGASEGLTKLGSMGAKGLKRVIGSAAGISKGATDTYAKQAKQVNSMINKQLRDEFLPQYADTLNSKIKDFVTNREGQIDDILSESGEVVDISPLVDTAEKEFNSVSAKAFTPQVKAQANKIFDQIKIFDQMKAQGVAVSAKDLNKMKRDLQDMAYNILEDSGFRKNAATEAFENMAEKARSMVNGLDSSGTIEKANKELSELIRTQEKLRIPNVFKQDGGLNSDSMRKLLSTLPNESKTGLRQATMKMDAILGSDISKTADAFKAAIELDPIDAFSKLGTGRTLLPIALGGAAGGAFTEGGAKEKGAGALAGAVLGSPFMTRPGITATRGFSAILDSPMAKQGLARGIYGAIKERTLK